MNVMFVETKSFSRRWPDYLSEDELREVRTTCLKRRLREM